MPLEPGNVRSKCSAHSPSWWSGIYRYFRLVQAI
jgi:hypothetical protein